MPSAMPRYSRYRARDRYGNLATKGFENFVATVESTHAAGNAPALSIAPRVTYRGSGMYSVWFKLLNPGCYTVKIALRGVEVNGSPVRVDAEKAALQSPGARQSRILGRAHLLF